MANHPNRSKRLPTDWLVLDEAELMVFPCTAEPWCGWVKARSYDAALAAARLAYPDRRVVVSSTENVVPPAVEKTPLEWWKCGACEGDGGNASPCPECHGEGGWWSEN
jgi:hypothetical protein